MVPIRIISVSKPQAGPYHALAEVFIKRLKGYADVELVPVKAEPFKSASERERVRKKEAERIRKVVPKGSVLIALDENGKAYGSKEFSEFMGQMEDRGDKLCFVIGGPLGLDPELIGDAQKSIALSNMTLPHDLALIMLLEQLFRAFTIAKDRTYHY